MTDHGSIAHCPHCASPLPPGALVCPVCRQLVYRARLVALMQEAQRLESVDPMLAANVWRQCLPLLPPESAEAQQIAVRAATLSGGMFAGPTAVRPVPLDYARPPERKETWLSVLLKTGGSMALSIYLYSRWDGPVFAIGFVLLILIHEMGHVIANWHYGIKQSPPIFIPYMGAVIFLKQNPPDAKAEAIIGIAGPVAGTAGALVCYILAIVTGSQMLAFVALFAFLMNLFNMVPCPPLDGGRVAAAISPWLWVPGVALFVAALWILGGRDWITLLLAFWILQSALPRIRRSLSPSSRNAPYYRIGARARAAVVVSYILLTSLLVAMLCFTPLWIAVRALVLRNH